MKKLLLYGAGLIIGIIALTNLGPMLALAFSAFIAFIGYRYFTQAGNFFSKGFWGVLFIIGLFSALSNAPAFIGLLAIIGLYYIWDMLKSPVKQETSTSNDPFQNFEQQWKNLKRS